jgi:hypothetical protein
MSITALSGVALLAAVGVLLLRELRGGLAPLLKIGTALFLFGTAIRLYAPVGSAATSQVPSMASCTIAANSLSLRISSDAMW